MAVGATFSRYVCSRLLDFFDDSSHWQRRLWNVGLVLSLREVIEACEAMRVGALNQAAVAWLVDSTRKKVDSDPGAGVREQRNTLTSALRGAPLADGVDHRVVRVALEDIRANYLRRWREELATSSSPPRRERAARAIASHLLDSGLPTSYLRSWLSDLLEQNPGMSIADVIDESATLIARPPSRHEVLVLFEVEPVSRAAKPTQWIDSARAARWLRENVVDFQPQQKGGLLLQVDAYGPAHAVERAAESVERFSARVSVGTRSEARFHAEAAVAGAGVFPLRQSRRVEVRALERENRVFQLAPGEIVDAAFELLSHLDSGPPAPAVAGAWAAIETLLRSPGDRGNVLAADRLAVLTACSWPRAELTDLAWSWARQGGDALADEINALRTSREKAQRIADAIGQEVSLRFNSYSDHTAVQRMKALLDSPRRLLLDVRDHVCESMRRLYRQRNLVMHGGRTEAVALSASLRTAAPLVGAGVDRIAHGYLTANVQPLELLARATVEIERAGTASAPPLTGLLE